MVRKKQIFTPLKAEPIEGRTIEPEPIFPEEPETQTVAVRRESSVRQVNAQISLHASDRPVIRMKLVQNTSSEGTPGYFIATDTLEEFPELYLVPMSVRPVRTLWPKDGFSRDRGPECASFDGEKAVESFSDGSRPLFPGAECIACQFYVTKPWMVPTGEQYCQPGYDVFGLSLDTAEVVGLRLQGTSAKIARVFARPGVWCQQIVRLYSVKKTSDRGSWWQLLAQPVGQVSPEEIQQVHDIMTGFSPAQAVD